MFAIIMQLSSCKDRITAIITACKCNYPNVRQPSGRQRFSSFSMLQAKIFLLEKSFAMLKAKILLIETLLSMSKGFLDHNLFHDPNVTTIHRDYPDNRAKDVRISILCPALPTVQCHYFSIIQVLYKNIKMDITREDMIKQQIFMCLKTHVWQPRH